MRLTKIISCTMALVLTLGLALPLVQTGDAVYGASAVSNTATNRVAAYIKPDVTVRFNAEIMEFTDANGNVVYPVICNGSTYLPVRAVSSLMDEEIEWRDTLQTIFIGKNLSNPAKIKRAHRDTYAQIVSYSAIQQASLIGMPAPQSTLVEMRVCPHFKVMYDFVEQIFKDVNGETIYPLVYNGTTYLPVRSVSALMNQDIDWDANTKTIYIGSKTPLTKVEEKIYKVSENTKSLRRLYDDAALLYGDATAAISSLGQISSPDELVNLSISISKYYEQAQALHEETRKVTRAEDLTETEQAAAEALEQFVGLNEIYIMCMENILYMVVNGEDFTIMQEPFEQYAIDTMTTIETARLAIEAL